MANREGINPLRPYYIPPSGLSPASNAPPEVTSPSSAQVFGNTARGFIPDIDYADYLDASPSVSDWVRDALNSALVRYTKVLTAQPFDVAKTILQVYVVPDAADEEWDRKPTPAAEGSSYDSVRNLLSEAHVKLRSIISYLANPVTYRSRSPTMRVATSPQRPLQRQRRVHLVLAGHDNISPIGVAIFDQSLRTSLRTY
jgi:fusion and transport protein UGO1